MNMSMNMPKEKGTFGCWIASGLSDVHVYTHNQSHEGSGVVIGRNPNRNNMKCTDPALILSADGKASLQFIADDGEIRNKPIEDIEIVYDAILGMLNNLKKIVESLD